jgi:hypothetical protein
MWKANMANYQTINPPRGGIIYEFEQLDQAKAFAAAVKRLFHLDARVFDNVEDAYRAHWNPFQQTPPVVHVDRPFWKLGPDADDKAWEKAWKIGQRVEKLAVKHGGTFRGT